MTKEKLVEKIRELLKTDGDLNFLLILKKEELERLVACIRDRVDQTDSSFTYGYHLTGSASESTHFSQEFDPITQICYGYDYCMYCVMKS